MNNAVSNNPPNASNTPEMKNKPASRFKALRKNVPSNNNGTENLTNAVGGRGDMNDSMISDKGLKNHLTLVSPTAPLTLINLKFWEKKTLTNKLRVVKL